MNPSSPTAVVINKENGMSQTADINNLNIDAGSVIKLNIDPVSVQSFTRSGNNLTIVLKSGFRIVVKNFFLQKDEHTHRNDLILEDSHGVYWWGQYSYPWTSFTFTEIEWHDGLPVIAGWVGAGLLGLAGLLAGTHGHSDHTGSSQESKASGMSASGEALAVNKGQVGMGQISVTDKNGVEPDYQILSGPSHGSVTIDKDGHYSYQPESGFSGKDNFTVRVHDKTGAMTTVTVPVIVHVAAVDDQSILHKDTVARGNVITNDTDSNSDPIHVTTFTVGGITAISGQSVILQGVGTLTIGSDGAYTFTPVTGYTGPVPPATYTITDGQSSSSATLSFSPISAPAINTPPVAENDSAVTKANTAVSGNVLSNDTDKDGDPLTVTGFTVAGQSLKAGETANITGVGTLTIGSDGAYTFTPVNGYTGPVPSATYTITDGQASSSATLSFSPISAPAINTPPVAENDSAVTKANTAVSGNVLSNDTDKDGDPLTVTGFTVDGQTLKAGETANITGVGTLTIGSNGAYTFTPVTGYTGPVPSATYSITDGQASSSATLSFSPISAPAINTPPVAENDSAVAKANTAVSGNVLSNDTDKDGDPLTVTGFTVEGQSLKAGETANITGVGTLTIGSDGAYTFTPVNGYTGPVPSATYTITDGQASASATLSFTAINTPPVAENDSAVAKANTAVSGNVLSNDTDKDGDVLTVTSFTVDGQTLKAGETATLDGVGTLTIGSDGTYTFTPVTGYTGPVPSATYTITDGQASSSATLSFTAINTPPVAEDDSAVAKANTAVSGNVLSNDTDKDGDPLTVTGFTVEGQTRKAGETANITGVGTLTIGSDGAYTFTPVANYTGPVPSATYTITDGQSTASATLSFTAINTPPVAEDDNAVMKLNTAVSGNVLSNDTDKDGDPLTVTGFTVDGQTLKAGETATLDGVGTLTIGSDGTYTFTPVNGYTGSVPAATYTITDGQATATAKLHFGVTNTTPVAVDDVAHPEKNSPVSGNVLSNDSDEDGNTLHVTEFTVDGETLQAGDSAKISGVGVLTISSNGDYTFTPEIGYAGPVPSATYTLTDGQETASATLRFTDIIDNPPNAVDDYATVNKNTPTTHNVLGNDSDPDGDSIMVTHFTIDGQTFEAGETATLQGIGTLTLSASGLYVFTPATGYSGPVPAATYTVSDGQLSSQATLYFSDIINTAPIATDDSATVVENTPVSGNVLSNDSDKDGDTLTVTGFTVNGQTLKAGETATLDGVGTLTIGSDGAYTFTPVTGYTGPVPSAVYTITDGQATASAILNFSAINTPPVATNDNAVAEENTPVSGNVLSNDTDKDGDTLTVTGFTVDGQTLKAGETATIDGVGTLTIGSDGAYTFTPVTGYTGPVPSATYTITDGQASASATLSFSTINTPPVAVDDNVKSEKNHSVSGNVLNNDTDADNDTLTVTKFTVDGQTLAAGETASITDVGTLTIGSDGAYTFTPVTGYVGPVPSATYTITDGQATSSATLSFSNIVNTPPTPQDDTTAVIENTPATGNVLSNDTDSDGDTLTVTQFTVDGKTVEAGQVVTIPNVGSLTINSDGTYNFIPQTNYTGAVPSAVYTVTDGQAEASATLNFQDITKNHTNTPPDAVDDNATAKENTAVSGNVLSNDTDIDGDSLTVTGFTVDGQTLNAGETATLDGVGTLTIGSDGTYTFTPVTGYTGPVPSATYTITDGQASSSATLSFTSINTPPVAENDSAVAKENTAVSGNVLANDTDKDGDTLTVTGFTVEGQTLKAGETATLDGVGTLTIGSNGAYTFTPVTGYTGPVPAATYTITDGQASASATLSFSAINTPPVAVNDYVEVDNDQPVSGNVLTNDTDKDGDTLSVTQFTVDGQVYSAGTTVTLQGVGTLSIDSDGAYTFTPESGYTGAIPLTTYTITDGQATAEASLVFDHAPTIEITQETEVTYTQGKDISGFSSSSWQNNWTSAGWKGVWPSYDSTNKLVNLSADNGSYTSTLNAATTFNSGDVLDLTVGWNNGWSGNDDGSAATLSFSYGSQALLTITTPGKSAAGTSPGSEYADAERYAVITLSPGIEVSLDDGKTWLDGTTPITFETWRLYQKDQTVTDSDLSHILVKGMETGQSDHLTMNWNAPGSPADDFQVSDISISQVTETTSASESNSQTYDPSSSSGSDSDNSQLAVMPNVNVSDSDSDTAIKSATITLAGKTGDQLWIDGMDATTHTVGKASYSLTSDGEGNLTLSLKEGDSGALTSSEWNTLLEGLRFGTTGDTGTRQLSVTVNDGQLDSNTEKVDINVTGSASSDQLPGYTADTQTTTTESLLSSYSLENVSNLDTDTDSSTAKTESLPTLQSLLSTSTSSGSSAATSTATSTSTAATDTTVHTTSETSSALLAKEDELSGNTNTV